MSYIHGLKGRCACLIRRKMVFGRVTALLEGTNKPLCDVGEVDGSVGIFAI